MQWCIRFLRGCREFFFVHESAIIDEGATIGEGSKVWQHMFVQVRRLAKMCLWGRTYLSAIEYLSAMAARFRTMSAFMTMLPLSKMFSASPSMVFTNVLNPRAAIERKSEFRTTVVRQGATLGANCTIVCGVEIGRFAFVGAGAVVTKSIPAYALVTGGPAKQVGWMSEFGEKLDLPLQGTGKAICPHTGAEYALEDGVLTCIYST